MPLDLVRLRTFGSVHWLLRCNINAGVHARADRADVSLRDHNSPRWKTGLASANDVTHRKHAEDLGNLKKASRVENWTPNETVDFRLLA